MKRYLLLLSLALGCLGTQAQLQSPEQFLGYPLGSRYTPHYQIVNYVNYIARELPQSVKLEQYGWTNEGRPLLLLFIASPENLSHLENIRKNNLRLSGMLRDRMAPTEGGPVIVWLSYNVHGNEPSSSEAALLTLYDLVNPASASSQQWLKNMVVIMDPCINPDGRDRYVNWITQVEGRLPNPYPQAREHLEPWPGGRTNHYNFDLNRDWAWQTQVETQQRLAQYNRWLPQVHVDFHEQGYNNPYYFAPAAEPYHEVITPWQREFQVMIGRNNARHFDQQGWLYFTKERFDLFYPSYGDTYPLYNGAIGMTFEQGGHSRGGLAVVNQDGDTLTLHDRLLHHYTTGMSTLELSAQQGNRLISEYRKYFSAAVSTPPGEFKSYILKNDGTDRIDRLKTLLDRNLIDWAYTAAGAASGVNYSTGKTETFHIGTGDIVVNANQPKANLVKVLLERSSKISDSATYDITAWSIPFAYGLQAYGLKEYFTATSATAPPAPPVPAAIENPFAYVVRWDGLNSARFLAELLNHGIRVRYSELEFREAGQDFAKGSLLITRTSNATLGKDLEARVLAAGASTGVKVYPIASGFVDQGHDLGSNKIHLISAPRVALLSGREVSSNGMGEFWHFFDQQLGYPITLVNAEDFGRLNLADFNVLILPDGNYSLFNNKEQLEQLKDWIRKGGRLLAIENAAVQISHLDWGLKLKVAAGSEKKEDGKREDSKKEDYHLLHRYEDRQKESLSSSMPGSIYRVELDNSHPLAFGYPDNYMTLKQGDDLFEFLGSGWNVGVIKKNNYVSGFTGIKTKEELKDGMVLGVLEMGRGNVIVMADNPLFRSFWENGKLLICNAVFLVGQ